jgi:hypothetical protein
MMFLACFAHSLNLYVIYYLIVVYLRLYGRYALRYVVRKLEPILSWFQVYGYVQKSLKL